MNFFFIDYCSVITDTRASEIQKCKDLPILSKLDCFCRSPTEVKICLEEFFLNRQKNQYAYRKSIPRIRGSLNIPF